MTVSDAEIERLRMAALNAGDAVSAAMARQRRASHEYAMAMNENWLEAHGVPSAASLEQERQADQDEQDDDQSLERHRGTSR